MNYTEFDQYIHQSEPSKRERANLWRTAIGLQEVDGLTPSDFLIAKAQENIEGVLTLAEVDSQIRSYYQSKDRRTLGDEEMEEADKVSTNIAKILSSRTFSFNANGFIATHRRIFDGVFKHAGTIRDYDISKREWVLDGDSVCYLNYEDLQMALDYDINQEKAFRYKGLSKDEIVAHIAQFASGLWQIHPFREGNTRTTAVFMIMYLRSIGFDVNNDLFATHSWYFRNALVRANYRNISLGIEYSPVYLERFFRNLLFNDGWDLRNRYLHISPSEEWKEQPNLKSHSYDDPTSTNQKPNKRSTSTSRKPVNYPTSTSQEPDNYQTSTVPKTDKHPTSTGQKNNKHPTSTSQVPDKHPTSTGQAPDKHPTSNNNIIKIVTIIGKSDKTVKEMLDALMLKNRENFKKVYLDPAIAEGFVCMLYPDSPRSPKQRYILTDKGTALYDAITD